ncbi:unnamed protein product [Absidia cylindrospora]
MGCCYSVEKPVVYEVTLDSDGVAHHVAEGQGTHYIYVSENNETILEEKNNSNHDKPVLSAPKNSTMQGTITPQHPSDQRIHPMNANEKK